MAPFLRSSRRLPSFLLDIDGTLVFTDHLYRKVFEKLLSPLGYDVTDEFYAANVHGKVDADVFGKLLPADTSEDELKAWSKLKDSTFVELYNEQTRADGKPPMLTGLPEALQRAQQLGVRCIAVTNAQRGAGEAAIASLKAHVPAASIIEGLSSAPVSAPRPRPLQGMRQLGRPRSASSLRLALGRALGVAAGVLGVVGIRSCLPDEGLRVRRDDGADWASLQTRCSAGATEWKANGRLEPRAGRVIFRFRGTMRRSRGSGRGTEMC